jgi:hypothetical protein
MHHSGEITLYQMLAVKVDATSTCRDTRIAPVTRRACANADQPHPRSQQSNNRATEKFKITGKYGKLSAKRPTTGADQAVKASTSALTFFCRHCGVGAINQ